jgi:hypothetical protein
VKSCGIFLDVDFDGDEFIVNERGELRVSVRFGFQPSACSSSGRRAEVNQHRFVLRFGLIECDVNVFGPRNSHQVLLRNILFGATQNSML